jgi:uncharacterized OB-fold protein
MMSERTPEPIAAMPYIVIDEGGDHFLVGSRCGICGATMLGKRFGCAACGEIEQLAHVRLADTGRIRTCTVITRSYPGIPVPFIAAVIAIDGGGVVRGTLHDAIPTDPVAEIGKPVRISIEDTGQCDPAGRPFYAQTFRPMEMAA